MHTRQPRPAKRQQRPVSSGNHDAAFFPPDAPAPRLPGAGLWLRLSHENIIGKPYMFSGSRLPDVLWHLPAIILPDKERAPVQPETEDDMAGNVEHPDLFGVGRFEAAMPAPM